MKRLLPFLFALLFLLPGCNPTPKTLTQLGLLLPLALTAAWAFLTIRLEDFTVLDFIRFAVKFTISTQQEYRWAEP